MLASLRNMLGGVESPPHGDTRANVANRFLRGRGAEIGAGLIPHHLPRGAEALHYDIRSPAELHELFKQPTGLPVRSLHQIGEDFPQGCDFVIAHNVLEHTPDPISTLSGWHTHVRTGGVVVLSLPDHRCCPDKDRVVATVEHLLLDFALKRTDQSFESKEHIAPFILGWLEQMWVKDFSGQQLAEFVLSEQRRDEGHDLHWHAFTPLLAASTVVAACMVEGRAAMLLADEYPDHPLRGSFGDIILVYRLGDGAFQGFPPECRAAVQAGLERLEMGLKRLNELRRL
jgi:SAM-dependent methyltransferase